MSVSGLLSISSTFSSVSTTFLLDFFSKSDQNAINLLSLKMIVVLKVVIMNFNVSQCIFHFNN